MQLSRAAIMKWLSKKCFLEITGNYQSCSPAWAWAAARKLLLMELTQVGADLFPSGLFTHFLACCPFHSSPVCPRVWVVDCSWGDQSANVKNKLNIHKLLIPRRGKYHRRPSEFSSCQLGVWNARRIIGSYQNSLNSFGAERKLTQSD